MSKAKIFLSGFVMVSLGEIISVTFNDASHYFFKPAILLMLIGFYLSSSHQRNAMLLRALFFCWVGDFLLLFAGKSELYFILGLVAFLIGHVFYIFVFRRFVWAEPSSLLPTQKLRYVFPVFLAGTGLIVILYPGLGPLRIPVILYSIILMIMVSFALLRVGRTNTKSFVWVFIGAALFMISDSLLAVNKFHTPFLLAQFYIMATYIVAQYAIVTGVLAHPTKTN